LGGTRTTVGGLIRKRQTGNSLLSDKRGREELQGKNYIIMRYEPLHKGRRPEGRKERNPAKKGDGKKKETGREFRSNNWPGGWNTKSGQGKTRGLFRSWGGQG